MNGSNDKPEYTIDRFKIREDYAFVNDIIIRTFDHIMWVGTTNQNISFLVTTPIKDIYTSSFLSKEVNFSVEENIVFPLMNHTSFTFNKYSIATNVSETITSEDDTKYFPLSHEYSDCSINTELQHIQIWHNTKAPEGKNYSQENDTDFICGKG